MTSLRSLFERRTPSTTPQQVAEAIRSGDAGRVRVLLNSKPALANATWPPFDGTWLHHAAGEPSIELLELLISLDLDVNAPDREGATPLTAAASAGHYANVEWLLNHGAEFHTTTSAQNPLFAAILGSVHLNASWPAPTGEASHIVRLLLERGIDAEKRYTAGSMTNMDTVAFAVRMGALDLARIIALWNAKGEKEAAEKAIIEAGPIAEAGLDPVPPGEQYRPS